MAHFEHSSVIGAPRTEVFEFVANLDNLRRLMPPDYKIEPTAPTSKLKVGTEFEMRMTRIGISVLWGGVIEEVIPNEVFRDRQSHGPFALWVHTHKFEDHGQGTLHTDLIEYDVPFGLMGKLADDLFVRHELKRIFTFRHKKIQEFLAKNIPEVQI